MINYNQENIYYKKDDQQKNKTADFAFKKFPIVEIFNIKLGDTRKYKNVQ